MVSLFSETLKILNESSLYLLLGFAMAGVLHVVMKRYRGFSALLTGRGPRPVILASILGLPLPLCSCSVIPAGLALRREGASKGTTSSFLISVPETDIVSILLTYGLLGPALAIFRPFAALVTAVATGFAVNAVEAREKPSEEDGAEFSEANGSKLPGAGEESDHHHHHDPQVDGRHWVYRAIHYGFREFFDDLALHLLTGIVLAGAISAWLPGLEVAGDFENSFMPYLVMLILGIPMYVCATASTPIAAGLIVGGVSPGAALVFLLAGPATNIANLYVLSRYFGRAAMAVYLACIAVISLIMGLWLDASLDADSARTIAEGIALADEPSFWQLTGTIVFLVFTIASLRRSGAIERALERVGLRLDSRVGQTMTVVVALGLYLGSGFTMIHPGERGIETRFGRITAAYLTPGLHHHWPTPFGAIDVVDVREIKRVEIGYRSEVETEAASPSRAGPLLVGDIEWEIASPSSADPSLIDEAWMLTGDENILDIQCVLHYHIIDTPEDLLRYAYGVGDKEGLVRGIAERAVRRAVGSVDVDRLLTLDRGPIEETIRDDFLQPALDACQSGLRAVDVKLLSVHAPPELHEAFRDVASAAEDQAQTVNLAREHSERVVREAQGEATSTLALARGSAVELVERARGEGKAFSAYRAAYEADPSLTRSRTYLELLDRVLPGLNKYIDMTSSTGERPEIWLQRGSRSTGPPMAPWESGRRSAEVNR